MATSNLVGLSCPYRALEGVEEIGDEALNEESTVDWKSGDAQPPFEIENEDVCKVLAETSEVSDGISAVLARRGVSSLEGF
jgi:hypothetical protein